MYTTHKIKMDLLTRQNIQTIHAVHDDTNSRYIEISLFECGVPWKVPENSQIAISYLAANGANGIYDTLPNGADAYIYGENKITIILIPSALYPGTTKVTVVISDENSNQISTFPLNVEVDENYSYGASKPETYINLRQWMTAELANLVWDYAVNVYPDQAGDGYVSERPYDAILREYESGRAVYCALEISDQERLQLPFVKIDGGVLYFSAVCAGKEYLVTITADGVTVEISECGGGNSGGNADVSIDGETLVIAENSTATIENETLVL